MTIARTVSRRALLSGGAAGLACLASPGNLLAQTSADAFSHVHPELRSLARNLGRAEENAAPKPVDHDKIPLPAGVRRVDIAGRHGAPDVPIYLVNEKVPGSPARGAILFIHGGGFVGGTARFLGPLIKRAERLDCLLVSVEYRLAPATPFPGALEDNYAALLWMRDHAAELGIDAARIALLGESAGGGHVAMLAIAARDRGEIRPRLQAMVYPMLDDRTGSSRKVPPHIGTLIWKAEDNRNGWTALLGRPAGSAKTPYGSVPSRTDNLKGLAPAWIGVGGIDRFAEEDIDYARRLNTAGVPVELLVVPGAFHGFDLMAPKSSPSRQFITSLEDALARALAP